MSPSGLSSRSTITGADIRERELLDVFDQDAAESYGPLWTRTARLMLRSAGPENATRPMVIGRSQVTGATGLEPATSGVTGRRSNQLNYAPGNAAV